MAVKNSTVKVVYKKSRAIKNAKSCSYAEIFSKLLIKLVVDFALGQVRCMHVQVALRTLKKNHGNPLELTYLIYFV